MALTQLGTTKYYVDLTKITAKTAVEKRYDKDIWHFDLLIDGRWFYQEFTTETAANNAWALYT